VPLALISFFFPILMLALQVEVLLRTEVVPQFSFFPLFSFLPFCAVLGRRRRSATVFWLAGAVHGCSPGLLLSRHFEHDNNIST
jgi:hypothetical protein